MTHRELQDLERRDIGAEIAALEHVEACIERHTTLPTSEIQKDIDVLKIEESIAKNLDGASPHVLGAIRGAKLLGLSTAAATLEEVALLIGQVQAEMAQKRGAE